jgi:hypothetical protein
MEDMEIPESDQERWRKTFQLLHQLKEELEEAEIYQPSDTRKALDSYTEERTQEFWRRLRNTKEDGLSKGDISRIFNVGSSRAYTLLDNIHLDYEEVGLIPNKGNKPKKLVHKKFYLIELIKEDFNDLAGQISESADKPIAKQNWRRLLKIYVNEIRKSEGNKAVNKSQERLNRVEQAKKVCGVEDVDTISLD